MGCGTGRWRSSKPAVVRGLHHRQSLPFGRAVKREGRNCWSPAAMLRDKQQIPPFGRNVRSDLRRTATYFRLFTYSATALASSAATPATAFLWGAFLASSPLVSRSVI